MAIEWGFGLAAALMVVGVAVGLLRHRWRPIGSEWPDYPGKVAPPEVNPIDLIGVLAVATIYFGFHLSALQAPPLADDAPALTLADIVASLFAQGIIAAMVMVMIYPRSNPVRFFGFRWHNWPWVFLIAPAATFFVISLLGTMEIAGYSQWMREHLDSEPLQRSVQVLRESRNPLLIGLMALTAVFVAPVCEEITFRGYIYPVIKHFGGPWVASIGSALLFASAHNLAVGLLPLFFLGLLLVAAYELTGSLWASIAVHACFNAFTVGTTLWARLCDVPFQGP